MNIKYIFCAVIYLLFVPFIAFADIIPHKAEYVLSYKNSEVPIGGYVLRLENDCQNQQYLFSSQITVNDKTVGNIEIISAYSEKNDHTAFEYQHSFFVNNRNAYNTKGNAKRKRNKTHIVHYNQDKKTKLKLDNDVLFPIQHTKKLLQAFTENKKFYNGVIYDGTESNKIFINALLLGKADFGFSHEQVQNTAYRVVLNQTTSSDQDENASSHFTASFLDSGVMNNMEFSIVNNKLIAKIVKLEILENSLCAK